MSYTRKNLIELFDGFHFDRNSFFQEVTKRCMLIRQSELDGDLLRDAVSGLLLMYRLAVNYLYFKNDPATDIYRSFYSKAKYLYDKDLVTPDMLELKDFDETQEFDDKEWLRIQEIVSKLFRSKPSAEVIYIDTTKKWQTNEKKPDTGRISSLFEWKKAAGHVTPYYPNRQEYDEEYDD